MQLEEYYLNIKIKYTLKVYFLLIKYKCGDNMKTILRNKNNLTENDITELVVRVKTLLINNNKILIANENGTFQFPGGHLEENETHLQCIKREILEETGIVLDDNEIKECIYKVTSYSKDWPEVGKNRQCDIYYYIVKTDKNPNLNNLNLTESEKNLNFEVEFIDLDSSIDFLNKNMERNTKNYAIVPDMIEAIKEYLNN